MFIHLEYFSFCNLIIRQKSIEFLLKRLILFYRLSQDTVEAPVGFTSWSPRKGHHTKLRLTSLLPTIRGIQYKQTLCCVLVGFTLPLKCRHLCSCVSHLGNFNPTWQWCNKQVILVASNLNHIPFVQKKLVMGSWQGSNGYLLSPDCY